MSKTRAVSFLFYGLLALSACTMVHPPAMPMPQEPLAPGRQIQVEANDNLYTIAQKYGVRLNEIIAVNNMGAPFYVKPGQMIFLPAKAGEAPAPYPAPLGVVENRAPLGAVESRAPLSPSSVTSQPLEPMAVEKAPEPPPAAAPPLQEAAPPVQDFRPVPLTSQEPAPEGEDSFAWPVRGTILSAFGPKAKGQDNDGINIAAPRGAPVTAAQGGTVVYADNKMKGFGNLILIKHKDGWVTAYAHLGRMIVKRDEIVAKGDMIGTVGATGGAGSPQLHFETRRDGKPVDPELVLR